ncbi:MAG: four helix bundle protein [Ignavibacteria bacterium]|nr:four helix bundle protein [Ignavibacteria bacterium]
MSSTMQQRSYELVVRVSHLWREQQGANQSREIYYKLFAAASEVGECIERATGAANRQQFRRCLFAANTQIKIVKLWIGVLDDIGEIEPETACPLQANAEEVHALLLASIRSSKPVVANGQAVSQI